MDTKKDNKFEICARAVIQKDGKILVCRFKGKDCYFFPGGHVEFFEKAEDALKRELKEELDMEISGCNFIGTVENAYQDDDDDFRRHEINLVFSVNALGEVKDKSMEDDLEFFFLDRDVFVKERILPIALRDSIVKWLNDGQRFWASQE